MNLAGVVLPLALYSGLNIADYKSSKDGLARGGQELNPVVSMIGLAPMKALSAAGLTLGDIAIARKHKHGVWVYRALVTVGYGAIVAHNRGIK